MKLRKQQNLERYVPAEDWFYNKIKPLNSIGIKFTRQARRGTRIFDFWCDYLGIAVEIDGSSHNERKDYDIKYDKYNYDVSGIIVYRINNYNENQANNIIDKILHSDIRAIRRRNLGLKLNKKWNNQIDLLLHSK